MAKDNEHMDAKKKSNINERSGKSIQLIKRNQKLWKIHETACRYIYNRK